MPPTLVDIARETNTSVSTVSRVLAGGVIANRISKETRERVQAAANRLGYRPNLVARTLRTRRSNTIALLVSDIANPFFGQIASQIEKNLHSHGYSLMLCNSGESAQREAEYLQLLGQKAIDGLILVPIAREKQALFQSFSDKLPLVILDRPLPEIDATVATDQVQAARLLCETIRNAGVQKVALVSGPSHVQTHRVRREAAEQTFDIVATYEGSSTRETGRQAVAEWAGEKLEAIICTNNTLAQGVMESMQPEQSPPVVGVFDEVLMMHLIPLPIACSAQDISGLAEGCVQQLLPMLRNTQDSTRKTQPLILPARMLTNPAFEKWRKARAVTQAQQAAPEPVTA